MELLRNSTSAPAFLRNSTKKSKFLTRRVEHQSTDTTTCLTGPVNNTNRASASRTQENPTLPPISSMKSPTNLYPTISAGSIKVKSTPSKTRVAAAPAGPSPLLPLLSHLKRSDTIFLIDILSSSSLTAHSIMATGAVAVVGTTQPGTMSKLTGRCWKAITLTSQALLDSLTTAVMIQILSPSLKLAILLTFKSLLTLQPSYLP